MKRLGLIAASVFLFGGAAFANDTMDVLTGGATLNVDGQYTVTFNDDGTYETSTGAEGTWSMDGDEICLERSTGESGCGPMDPGKSVGDSWDGFDIAGNAVTLSIE